MATKAYFLFLISLLVSNSYLIAEVRLPGIFSDYMVLQRDQKVPIWGTADPGETVEVEFAGQTRRTSADPEGQWVVYLDPMSASNQPQSLVVKGRNQISFENILVGEVWLASGQSNMQFNLGSDVSAVQEIAHSDYPGIRVLTVGRNSSLKGESDIEGTWEVCSPDNAASFSAVAYYFGSSLHKDLVVPVGIIVSAWGGTNAEEWTAIEYLGNVEEFEPILERWNSNRARLEHLFRQSQELSLTLENVHFYSEDNSETLLLDDFEDRDLRTSLFGVWSSQSQDAETSALQVQFDAEKGVHFLDFSGQSSVGRNLVLGVQYAPGRMFDLSQYDGIRFVARGIGFLKFHSIQPDIVDWDNYSTDLIPLDSEGKEVTIRFEDLKQAGWGLQMPLRTDQLNGALFELHSIDGGLARPPAGLFNGMIKPLCPYAVRGVLWYQGEGNAGRSYQYRKLLPAMIQSWRDAWQQDFPFLIVQLPNFKKRQPQPSESGWAELREAQLMTSQSVSGAGLAVTIDLGEAEDVHPKDKSMVGSRLEKLALGKVYGKPIAHQGPEYLGYSKRGSQIRIQMRPNGQSLASAGGSEVRGFAIAGSDRKFYWAEARIEGSSIVVWSDQVRDPAAVRYAWADNPGGSLYNAEGFPASPFRTDDWPGITADQW